VTLLLISEDLLRINRVVCFSPHSLSQCFLFNDLLRYIATVTSCKILLETGLKRLDGVHK